SQSKDGGLVLDVEISGNGDSRLLQAPDLDLGDQFEVFDPQMMGENVSVSDGEAVYQKTWRYSIIPRVGGSLTLVPKFTYLDPNSGKYVTIAKDSFSIESDGPMMREDLAIDHSGD